MAQRIANRPRPADDFLDLVLAAQPFQAARVVRSRRLVVPTDGPADLGTVGFERAGRVVRGREAARHPVLKPAEVPQSRGDGPRTGARLAFELHQVELTDAALGPEVGRQPDLGQRSSLKIERQALGGTGAEIPAGD